MKFTSQLCKNHRNHEETREVLLISEIWRRLIGSSSHYLQDFMHRGAGFQPSTVLSLIQIESEVCIHRQS